MPARPVAAIYDSHETTPKSQTDLIEANDVYRVDAPGAITSAEAIVHAHIEAHPDLMNLTPGDQAPAHEEIRDHP